MLLIERTKQAYAELPARDRQILRFALPLILLLVAYLLIYRPISDNHEQAMDLLDAASEDYYWLRNQQTNNVSSVACAGSDEGADGVAYLQAQAKKFRLKAVIEQPVNGLTNITIAKADGRSVLRYVATVACNGYEVKNLSLERSSSDKATVSVQLAVQQVVGGN